MSLNRTDILVAAIEAVQDRNARYGEPKDNFERAAILWNAYLACRSEPARSLTAADVAILKILMKVARLANDPAQDDGWIDIAGYAACGGECATD